MKTLHINAANQKMNRTREQVRLIMIVAGIVTAIICSLALLSEAHPAETYESTNGMIETSKMITTDLSIQIASKAVASVLWPL
jgi:hypothetical protein